MKDEIHNSSFLIHNSQGDGLLKQSQVVLEALAPVVDGTAVLLGFFFLADMSASFAERRATNVVALTLVYFVFCVAVYLIRKLEPQLTADEAKLTIPAWLTARPTMTVLAVLFGLTLAVLCLAIGLQPAVITDAVEGSIGATLRSYPEAVRARLAAAEKGPAAAPERLVSAREPAP